MILTLDTHCVDPPIPDNSTFLESDWDGNPVDFDTSVEYKCTRGMKFETNFSVTALQTECKKDNVWIEPTWMNCTESNFIKISVTMKEVQYIMHNAYLAKYCPEPPNPGFHGNVTVHSDGLMFGHVCSTGGVYQPISNNKNSSCNSPMFKQEASYTDVNGTLISEYKININKNHPLGGSVVMLFTFSQPASPSTVKVTGSVSIKFNLSLISC